MSKDTFIGASKKDIAIATVIGVFILFGSITASGFYQCYNDPNVTCPSLSQVHFDRIIDLMLYLGMAGAIFIGLRITRDGNNMVPNTVVMDTPSNKTPSTI